MKKIIIVLSLTVTFLCFLFFLYGINDTYKGLIISTGFPLWLTLTYIVEHIFPNLLFTNEDTARSFIASLSATSAILALLFIMERCSVRKGAGDILNRIFRVNMLIGVSHSRLTFFILILFFISYFLVISYTFMPATIVCFANIFGCMPPMYVADISSNFTNTTFYLQSYSRENNLHYYIGFGLTAWGCAVQSVVYFWILKNFYQKRKENNRKNENSKIYLNLCLSLFALFVLLSYIYDKPPSMSFDDYTWVESNDRFSSNLSEYKEGERFFISQNLRAPNEEAPLYFIKEDKLFLLISSNFEHKYWSNEKLQDLFETYPETRKYLNKNAPCFGVAWAGQMKIEDNSNTLMQENERVDIGIEEELTYKRGLINPSQKIPCNLYPLKKKIISDK